MSFDSKHWVPQKYHLKVMKQWAEASLSQAKGDIYDLVENPHR
jgi:hypothetical protein